jgi:hypothetical protein
MCRQMYWEDQARKQVDKTILSEGASLEKKKNFPNEIFNYFRR